MPKSVSKSAFIRDLLCDAMQLGDYRVEIIQDTEFRLDGGAMFGVVPRKLWAQGVSARR